MPTASWITSRRFCLIGLAIVIGVSGSLSLAVQSIRSDEDFLAMALLKTRLQQELIEADISAADKELQANSRTIKEAEERMAIARETYNKQGALVPGIDLRDARAARRNIKNTLSRLESARATAGEACAIIKEKLVSSESRGPDSRIIGMTSPSLKQFEITKPDGRKALLKQNKPGFLVSGDEISARGAGGAELLFLDGRGTARWDGESRLKIVEASRQEPVLQLVGGKVLLAVESPEDLQGRLKDRAQGPDDDLTLVLNKYRGLSGSDFAQLFGKELRTGVPGAVCAARRARFTVEVKTGGETEIVVLEGTVDISDVNGRDHLVVEEGFGALVTKGGLLGPRRLPI